MDEISRMVLKAKKEAGISHDTPLQSLVSSCLLSPQCCVWGYCVLPTQGMALSGGEQEEAQRRIKEGIKCSHPHTSTHYHVCTDTYGSIATAFPNGNGVHLLSL